MKSIPPSLVSGAGAADEGNGASTTPASPSQAHSHLRSNKAALGGMGRSIVLAFAVVTLVAGVCVGLISAQGASNTSALSLLSLESLFNDSTASVSGAFGQIDSWMGSGDAVAADAVDDTTAGKGVVSVVNSLLIGDAVDGSDSGGGSADDDQSVDPRALAIKDRLARQKRMDEEEESAPHEAEGGGEGFAKEKRPPRADGGVDHASAPMSLRSHDFASRKKQRDVLRADAPEGEVVTDGGESKTKNNHQRLAVSSSAAFTRPPPSHDGTILPNPLLGIMCAAPPKHEKEQQQQQQQGAASPPSLRRAFGTLEPLPNVSFIRVHTAGIVRATICNTTSDPLRVTILLDGAGMADAPARSLGDTQREYSPEEAIRAQVAGLTESRDVTNKRRFVGDSEAHLNAAVVTVMAPIAEGPSTAQSGQTSGTAVTVAVLYYTPRNVSVVLPPTVVDLPSWARGEAADTTTPFAARASLLEAIADAVRHKGDRHGLHRLRALEHITLPPHFAYQLPGGALLSSNALGALCLNDPILNEESEATAVYPYDKGGGFVFGDGTQRLPLAFVHPLWPAQGSADDYAVNLVTSCRTPIRVPKPAIDANHYTKGGSMVMRGFGRYAQIDLEGLASPSAVLVRGGGGEAEEGSGGVNSMSGASVSPANNKVFVNFLAGVNEDTFLKTNTPRTRSPERIFAMRRAFQNGCSDDPINNPTRVVSHLPFYLDRHMDVKKSREVFVRVLKAAAAMAPFSDVFVTTNQNYTYFRQTVRASARRMLTHNFTAITPPPPLDPSVFMDTHYPSQFGEFVLIDISNKLNRHHDINGLTEFHILGGKGFYDVTRYSEEDMYITRDQFNFFCATLPWMEQRNYYLNYMRFEFNKTLMDRHQSYDVTRSYAPHKALYIDMMRYGRNPFYTPHSEYEVSTRPRALLLTYNPRRSSGGADTNAKANGMTDLYDVKEVPVDTCFTARHFNPSERKKLLLDSTADPTRPSGEFPQSDDISGCYVIAGARQLHFNSDRVYNGMFIIPESRMGHVAKNRYLHRPHHGLVREIFAHFGSPVRTYSYGVLVYSAFDGPVFPTSREVDAMRDEAKAKAASEAKAFNDTAFEGLLDTTLRSKRSYTHSRFTCVHHGSNGFYAYKPIDATPNIFYLSKMRK